MPERRNLNVLETSRKTKTKFVLYDKHHDATVLRNTWMNIKGAAVACLGAIIIAGTFIGFPFVIETVERLTSQLTLPTDWLEWFIEFLRFNLLDVIPVVYLLVGMGFGAHTWYRAWRILTWYRHEQ
jgi:hypothetical protein